MKIHCATSNPGKLREFQLVAPDFEIVPVSLPAPEETGKTFEENALLKARYYGAHVDGFLFVDDSGIEVDALSGRPGVDSAHFDNDWLLEQLRGIEDRTARFVCVIALVRNGELVRTFRGEVEGRVTNEPRGTNGFGYDPIFFYEPFGCTFGEADTDAKMRVSHRAQALQKMFTFLRTAST
ncbi:MAG TPA: RdgB/HAM1 family non-canonical purine NTP pyrophosphatase [Bryobacteraceae bacterium]|nr:RdgB/HAM1 family non-canonical purine NTP pyrophosphatase [Bryobacteraceae bacterium]